MVHTFSPRPQEAGASRSQLQASLGYRVCLFAPQIGGEKKKKNKVKSPQWHGLCDSHSREPSEHSLVGRNMDLG